uniref:Uncharacterized protein n=1 Tax=Anguilla anguilla TaxID=7936 RepID=A0A0E9SPP3_ANGAN
MTDELLEFFYLNIFYQQGILIHIPKTFCCSCVI